MCKAKKLQDRIDQLQDAVAKVCPTHTDSVAKIAQLQSEIFVAATQLAELSTRRIVRLTVALLILTAGLFIYTILLYQDAHADIHHRDLTEHHQFQAPETPESKP